MASPRVNRRMHDYVNRLLTVSFLVLSLNANCLSQESTSESSKEFWPEVDVYVPLNDKWRLFFLGLVTKANETRDNLEAQVGAHLDYIVNKRLVLRGGYRYRFSLVEKDPSKEHRFLAEQTFRQELPWNMLLSDRNRQEFRFINGDFSFRYRNRLRLEREFLLMKRSITPYGSVEVYHDSRFGVWNRNRLTVGTEVQLRKALPLLRAVAPRERLILDIYYTKQNDSRSEPNHVHAIGTALQIYF